MKYATFPVAFIWSDGYNEGFEVVRVWKLNFTGFWEGRTE
jgi:hypothetical protein